MSREVIIPSSHEEWLALRARDITSTEISALFGLSPYLGKLELWHRKKNNEIVKIEPSERMKWGTRLESSIALGAAEEHGWVATPRKSYTRIPVLRIGSSFDFEARCPQRGIGLLEVKNVDSGAFARHWIEHADGSMEAPDHIELQLQHQLLVADLEWGAIVALVGGNTLRTIVRQRDQQVSATIKAMVHQFWTSIEANEPPAADYAKDAEFIIKNLRANADDGVVVAADPSLESLFSRYLNVQEAIDTAETTKEAIKAEILHRIGGAAKVISNIGTLSCGNTKPNPGKLITAEMVGSYHGARAGFRQFRFTPKSR